MQFGCFWRRSRSELSATLHCRTAFAAAEFSAICCTGQIARASLQNRATPSINGETGASASARHPSGLRKSSCQGVVRPGALYRRNAAVDNFVIGPDFPWPSVQVALLADREHPMQFLPRFRR